MKEKEQHGHNFIRHAGIYLIARGLPGILAFLSIPLFSRLLSPAEYGKYALVIATVNLVNAIFFAWLYLAMVRFLAANRNDPARLKSTLMTVSLLLIAIAGLAVAVVYIVPAWRDWRSVALLTWVLLAAQAPYDLFSEYTRAQIMPWRFMILQFTRSLLGTFLGAALIKLGASWWGPLMALVAGMVLPVLYSARRDWSDVRLMIDREILARVCQYAIPLSITVALAVVIGSSDRFLVAWLKGDDAAGLYSVASDLTGRTLTLLMIVINLAVYPLAVRALEEHGKEAAQRQMRHNASLLLGVGVPSVVGLTVLSGSICFSFLGSSFRLASDVIPLLALGSFLGCFKAYHWDAAFQFVHQTIHQVWIVLIVAVINIGLNLMFIPHFGINGAAVASVIAYVISIVLTAIIGRRYFVLPMPVQPMVQVLLASAAMALALWPLRSQRGLTALSIQMTIGAAVYLITLIAQNFLDLRTHLLAKFVSAKSDALEPAMISAEAVVAAEIQSELGQVPV